MLESCGVMPCLVAYPLRPVISTGIGGFIHVLAVCCSAYPPDHLMSAGPHRMSQPTRSTGAGAYASSTSTPSAASSLRDGAAPSRASVSFSAGDPRAGRDGQVLHAARTTFLRPASTNPDRSPVAT